MPTCERCWRCCITADTTPYYQAMWLVATGFQWLPITETVYMCPAMSVDDVGQPHCLIYSDRPRICRQYVCEHMGVKHPHTQRCSLCGQRYAVLNSTFHISSSYRRKYCETCTQIMLNMERKLKVALKVGE